MSVLLYRELVYYRIARYRRFRRRMRFTTRDCPFFADIYIYLCLSLILNVISQINLAPVTRNSIVCETIQCPPVSLRARIVAVHSFHWRGEQAVREETRIKINRECHHCVRARAPTFSSFPFPRECSTLPACLPCARLSRRIPTIGQPSCRSYLPIEEKPD